MTGHPSYFNCVMCRRSPCLVFSHDGKRLTTSFRCKHTQQRTGRTRPWKPNGNLGLGLRVHHQYECECGHVGWSRIKGVEDLPLKPSE